MSDDAIKTTILGAILAALTTAVGWLLQKVLKNREDLLTQQGQIEAIKTEVAALRKDQISQECVREVIEDALNKRDAVAQERRLQWDETLALRIDQAMTRGQAQLRAELELLVPRIVREVIHQTGRRPRRAGADDSET